MRLFLGIFQHRKHAYEEKNQGLEYLMKKIQCKTLTAANGSRIIRQSMPALVDDATSSPALFFRANNHCFY